MAVFNRWSFRGFPLRQGLNTNVGTMQGVFALPPLRGDDFLTMNRTGQIYVQKVHDSRVISLMIVVRDTASNAKIYFDQLSVLFANRSLGALVQTLEDGSTRTGQAECVGWTGAVDISDDSGSVFAGMADFSLPDPWLYGPTVTGSVAPTTGGAALTIANPGTVTAESMTLDILGPITTPVVSNATTGTSLTIAVTVASTKHLLVDVRLFTAANDGANVIGLVTHSGAVPFLTLAPGNNALTVSGGSTTGASLVTLAFAPAYV
jgi:hypothetical protein